MTHQPERPEQGKFSKDETNFLKTHLPAYGALCHQLGAYRNVINELKTFK